MFILFFLIISDFNYVIIMHCYSSTSIWLWYLHIKTKWWEY